MNLFSVNSFFGILIIIFLVFFLLVGLFSLMFLARLFTLVIRRKKGIVDTLASCHPSAPPPSQLPSYSEAVIDMGYRDNTAIDTGYRDDVVSDMGYSDHPPCYADIKH